MGLLRRIWDYLVEFLLSEPGQPRRRTAANVRDAMLRELDSLRKIAALSRAQADAAKRQAEVAEHRSDDLESTTRSLVQQGHEEEARNALRLKLENDRLVERLHEHARIAEQEAEEDQSALKTRELEVREQLERMRQMEALEALNAQRRELEAKRRELSGEEIRHTLHREEDRIRGEASRLHALAGLQTDASRVAAAKVAEGQDEETISRTIAVMKGEVK